jgi:hypothetical protein
MHETKSLTTAVEAGAKNGPVHLVGIFEMSMKQTDSQQASEGCETMKN